MNLKDKLNKEKDERGQEPGNIGLSHSPESREQRDHAAGERVAEELGGQSKADGHFERLRQCSDGQASRSESNDGSGIGADKGNQRNHSTGNDFDIEQARAALAGEQRSLAEGFGKWQERNDAKQRPNDSAASRDPKQPEQANERDKKIYMQTEIKNMRNNVQDSVSQLERKTLNLIGNARKTFFS
ncbi:hypothetical protein GCM10020331_012800 [Ectobacillus funiculus]